MPYTVFVADNFDFGFKDGEWYEYGQFETYEAALDAAHAIVNRSLLAVYRTGMTGEALFQHYKSDGEDPFIRPNAEGHDYFSAWTYAEQRCKEICAPPPVPSPGE